MEDLRILAPAEFVISPVADLGIPDGASGAAPDFESHAFMTAWGLLGVEKYGIRLVNVIPSKSGFRVFAEIREPVLKAVRRRSGPFRDLRPLLDDLENNSLSKAEFLEILDVLSPDFIRTGKFMKTYLETLMRNSGSI